MNKNEFLVVSFLGLRLCPSPRARSPQKRGYYLQHEQYEMADTILAAMSQKYEYVSVFAANYAAYLALFDIKKQVKQSNRTIRELTASELLSIQNIANNTEGESAAQAQSILCFVLGDCREVVPFVPEGSSSLARSSTINTHNDLSKLSTKVAIYPNPVKDYTTIEYSLPEYVQGTLLSITDITGKQIKQLPLEKPQGQLVWDTREIPVGIYLLEISDKVEKLYTGKITVIK